MENNMGIINQKNEEEIIDLGELFLYITRHWYILALCMILAAGCVGYYKFSRPNTYTSEASILIQAADTNSSNTTLSEVQLSNALSKDFIELATCKPVLDAAIAEIESELGITMTRKAITSSVTITNTKNTRMLYFYAKTTNPELSRCIAQAMAVATAKQVSAIMNANEPSLVDHAEIENPDNKNVLKFTALGGLAGLFIPLLVLIVLFVMNDSIITDEDVRKHLDVNVIGVISLDKNTTYKMNKQKRNSFKKIGR